MRGPESSLITWSPNKEIIRVLQLVLLCVPVSIGWHHCRTQYVIGPRNWGTTMWPATIGWWRRVSPTINTTQGYPRGSVYCLVLWELVRAWGSTPPSAGSAVHHRQQPLLRDSPPVERARPFLHSILCTAVETAQPRKRRSGAPGDTHYSCVVYTYKGLVMYSWINVLLKLTLDSVFESIRPGSRRHRILWRAWSRCPTCTVAQGGTTRESLEEEGANTIKNIHNEKASRP